MKKKLLVSALGLVVAISMSASTGWTASKIDGKLSNTSKVSKSANIAIGKNNKANMGSINMTGGSIGKTGVVTNNSTVDRSANIAIGKRNEASMGSVQVE